MRLSVVGHCPACGAPIYGKKTISDTEQPVSKKSCVCMPVREVIVPSIWPAPVAPAPEPFRRGWR